MAKVSYLVVNGMVLQEDRDGTVREYRPDTLGNTVALTDATTTTDTWEYWPYGEVRSRTGSNPTPFQFVGTLGYYRDSSTRTYVRARHYRQGIGRWQTVDPLWPREKPYAYVGGAPQSRTDWLGLIPGGGLWRKIIVECGIGLVSAVADILGGKGFPAADFKTLCKMGAGCLAAVIGLLVASLFGPAVGPCIGGAVASVLAGLGALLCDPPWGPCKSVDWPCLVADLIVGAVGGCLGGYFTGDEALEVIGLLRGWLFSAISGLTQANCKHSLQVPPDYVGGNLVA